MKTNLALRKVTILFKLSLCRPLALRVNTSETVVTIPITSDLNINKRVRL
jgi:hypothetical protein